MPPATIGHVTKQKYERDTASFTSASPTSPFHLFLGSILVTTAFHVIKINSNRSRKNNNHTENKQIHTPQQHDRRHTVVWLPLINITNAPKGLVLVTTNHCCYCCCCCWTVYHGSSWQSILALDFWRYCLLYQHYHPHFHSQHYCQHCYHCLQA